MTQMTRRLIYRRQLLWNVGILLLTLFPDSPVEIEGQIPNGERIANILAFFAQCDSNDYPRMDLLARR